MPPSSMQAMSFSFMNKSYALGIPAPLELDWQQLYKIRAELERRWSANPHVTGNMEDKENAKAWEPRTRRLVGHTDR